MNVNVRDMKELMMKMNEQTIIHKRMYYHNSNSIVHLVIITINPIRKFFIIFETKKIYIYIDFMF
jgi:hypothetical protein